MDAAGAENGGGYGALEGFRSGMIGHARRQRAGGHTVIDEHDQHRVDHPAFFCGGHAAHEHQVEHLGKRDLAQQLFVEIVAADENPIELRFAHGRDEFRCFSPLLSGSTFVSLV